MIRIVIGTERDQLLPQKVLEYTLRLHSSTELDIRPVHQQSTRIGGTNFGFVRFLVPSLFGYSGKAIYQDADQVVLTEISSLWESLDDKHTFALVNRPQGYFGSKPVGLHNQTSVMVMNCAHLKEWDPKTLFERVVPNTAKLKTGQIHYRDFMVLSEVPNEAIQPLDPSWNHFNIVESSSKIVHFSHVRSQPWKNSRHLLTPFWGDWLKRAILDGFVSPRLVWKEVLLGHVRPHVLKFVPFKLPPFRKYEYKASNQPIS